MDPRRASRADSSWRARSRAQTPREASRRAKPVRPSKPAGRGSPTVGRFDSCAAPSAKYLQTRHFPACPWLLELPGNLPVWETGGGAVWRSLVDWCGALRRRSRPWLSRFRDVWPDGAGVVPSIRAPGVGDREHGGRRRGAICVPHTWPRRARWPNLQCQRKWVNPSPPRSPPRHVPPTRPIAARRERRITYSRRVGQFAGPGTETTASGKRGPTGAQRQCTATPWRRK